MLRVRELAGLARRLDAVTFEKQMGPFALVQRPSSKSQVQRVRAAGASATVPLPSMAGYSPAPVDFEDLLVATLPPPSPSGQLELIIGRSPDCDVVVEDAAVSSRHASIVWNGTAGLITELGSSNGTFINTKKMVKRATLASGDQLGFGLSSFIYLLAPALHERMRRGIPLGD